MQHDALLKSIERGVLAPVYLIYGEETYLQEMLIKNLRSKIFGPEIMVFNYDEINGEKAGIKEILESANTLPIFGEKRLVLVRDPLFFSVATKDEELLLDYLQDPISSTCLIFWVKGGVDKRKKTYKSVSKYANPIFVERLKGYELEAWIKNEVIAAGKKLDKKALDHILMSSSNDLRTLKSELEKLIVYAGQSSTITFDMAEDLVTKTNEANIFILIDSIGQKLTEKALAEMRAILYSGEPPVRVVFMIARHYRLLLLAKELESKGHTEKKIAAELKVQPFIAAKLMRQSKQYNFYELEADMASILDCDLAIKNSFPAKMALEDLILKLSWRNKSLKKEPAV